MWITDGINLKRAWVVRHICDLLDAEALLSEAKPLKQADE